VIFLPVTAVRGLSWKRSVDGINVASVRSSLGRPEAADSQGGLHFAGSWYNWPGTGRSPLAITDTALNVSPNRASYLMKIDIIDESVEYQRDSEKGSTLMLLP
jgi:hypothetical protein